MAGPDAVMTGWESLRDVMRSIEIRSREQFAEWIHQGGEVTSAQGCKNVFLNVAVAHDARVSAFGVNFRVGDIGRV